jgi:holo-[acyl-carrier protein] synthase
MSAMTRLSVGVDLVSIPRIQSLLDRWGDRFLRRVYTDHEIAYCLNKLRPAISLAGRFAAKEAFFKAVSGWSQGSISHKQIEVLVDPSGIPSIRPHGEADRALGASRAALSISHDQDMAVAVVVASSEVES